MEISTELLEKLMDSLKENESFYPAFHEIFDDNQLALILKEAFMEIVNNFNTYKKSYSKFKSRYNQSKARYTTQVINKYYKFLENDFKVSGKIKNELPNLYIKYQTLKEAADLIQDYEVPDPKDVIATYIKKIQDWEAKKINSRFFMYPLFKELDTPTKTEFITFDIRFFLWDLFERVDYKDYIFNPKQSSQVLLKSNIQIDYEVLGTSRTKHKVEAGKFITDEDDGRTYVMSTMTKNPNVRAFYSLAAGNSDIQNFPALNSEDDRSFANLLNFRGNDFLQTNRVTVGLKELTLKLYPDTKRLSYHKQLVKKSLINTYNHGFYFEDEQTKESIRFRYITELTFKLNEDKTDEIVDAIISHKVVDSLFIQAQVTALYEEDMKGLTGLEWGLAFYIQKVILQNQNNKKKTITINYNEIYIRQAFPVKNSKIQNIQLINDALNEFKNRQILIEDYSHFGEIFTITIKDVIPPQLPNT